MKRIYEEPLYEELILLSESVMTASGEEESEEIVDSELHDNEVQVFDLLNNLFKR